MKRIHTRRGNKLMSKSILPYAKVLRIGEEIDYIVIRFTGFNSNILVNEQYCVNPSCSCTEAILTFVELSDEGSPVNEWFVIRIDMQTWEVTDKKVINKMIRTEEMINEFVDNIDEYKEKLLSHFIKAKAYGKKNYLEYISESTVKMILEGDMLGYSEIFGSCDIDKFSFEYNDTEKWFFNDQYCSNPKCLCNEVVLTFYKIDISKKTQEQDFAVRMSLKNFTYNIEYNKFGADKISEVINYLKANRPEVFRILKRRYDEIKSASKEVIKKFALEEKKEKLSNVKIGRNDSCPCGSGKKYKKCCGGQASM